jgi:DNA-directed RNA polymerase specialized sigma subunit
MVEQDAKERALDWVLEKLAAAKKTTAPASAPPPVKAPKKITVEQKKNEVELWRKWNDNGQKPKDLEPLIKSFNPMIQRRVNLFKNRVEIPTSAIEYKHKELFVQALKTWDQKKGGALNTWIDWNLRKGVRYIDSNKNFARIPENISQHIGAYKVVKSELAEKLGHEPDAHAIHDHILTAGHPTLGRLSLKDIGRIEKEQRRGLIQTGHDIEELGGAPHMSSRAEEVKLLIIHQLTPEERLVHEYTFGLNGKPKLKPGEMAKKLKMDNSKVSKLRRSILNKMQPYCEPGDV